MEIREIENEWITLSDGTRLAARIWLPVDAEDAPVPAILEYLPYRKDDGTALQDQTRHPYFAERGYAAVRVDIRGTGGSDGIICDEYTAQEHDDALEVIAYLAEQPWCSGAVGMIGYSWGGFNGLQVAARRPPALKAVVTMYSTDDRYADDCHYMGGCLLASDMLKWASSMRGYNALPPDPRFRDDWREVWLDRLERTPAFIEPWLSHQTYDAFWKHGSVAEDYSAIEAATLVVGGWADAYTNAVPRLLEHLTCERRGIIGPWAHVVPYAGVPGPAIDFLAECVRWFDRYLKGVDTGVEGDPMLRVWMQESVAPATYLAERPGRWIAEDSWPPRGADAASWCLLPGGVLERTDANGSAGDIVVRTPQHLGATAGVWCANGMADELAEDQRPDDAMSAVFDSAPLQAPLEVLGTPLVRLRLSADQPRALVAARLCEVASDGSSTLVSYGLLNLTHRAGHETPKALEPGEWYEVVVGLNVVGQRFSAGNRIRLAISPTYWPHAWPSPASVALTLDLGACSLELPELTAPGETLRQPFGDPVHVSLAALHRGGDRRRTRRFDAERGVHVISDREFTTETLPSGTTYTALAETSWSIAEDDPLSARVTTVREETLEREGWHVRVACEASMWSDVTEFFVEDTVTAFEDGVAVFSADRRIRIPRNQV